MIQAGNDVISFLKQQHEQVKALFEDVIDGTGQSRLQAFDALRRLLAVHETAEEEIVHPAARKSLPDGKMIVKARLQEEHDAKDLLASLEKLDVSSAEFADGIVRLQAAVIAHAQAEEEQEFLRLGAILDDKKLELMRKAAEVAEKLAPTHPHSGVESSVGNVLAGPFASMMDRARDALGSRH
jgi:hemerythrin superfamily protein